MTSSFTDEKLDTRSASAFFVCHLATKVGPDDSRVVIGFWEEKRSKVLAGRTAAYVEGSEFRTEQLVGVPVKDLTLLGAVLGALAFVAAESCRCIAHEAAVFCFWSHGDVRL